LIGGSIALALKAQGWFGAGDDLVAERVAEALELGIIDEAGLGDPAITFVASPAGSIATQAKRALDKTRGLVTDVGSVKAAIVTAVDDPRFLGGHPMAGSEQVGLTGSLSTMFDGAVWVLTPSSSTPDETISVVRRVISSFGTDLVVLSAERHDELVAMISHVPHLTAATLMRLATERSLEHRSLLRLAAGGFREMTRVAAGLPDNLVDIFPANHTAITGVLDDLIEALTDVREKVAAGDGDAIHSHLSEARSARINLPSTALDPSEMTEVRIPITDQPGELQRVLTLAGELDVNVYDIEIAHTAEGDRGVLIVVVSSSSSPLIEGGLIALGYRPRTRALS
jgi:prephenate dehydrogenase